jgi:hypothetical protein
MFVGDMPAEHLTPVQQEIVDRLVSPGQQRPNADLSLAAALRKELDHSLADLLPLSSWSGASPLWLRKESLSAVHACEEYFVATLYEPFQWNSAVAKGVVTHQAVRLHCGGHSGNEWDLVQDAISTLQQYPGSAGLGEFLSSLTEGGRADLISRALPAVETFFTSWPPLGDTTAIPDYPVKTTLLDRSVVVSGKVDVAFGSPRRVENDIQSRRVLLELKTGGEYVAEHRQDAFLYALLETLKTRVAPFRVATWYLDSGTLIVDTVDEDMLHSAMRRLSDGVRRVVELNEPEEIPIRKPGWRCRFCPCAEDCDVALSPVHGETVNLDLVIRAVMPPDID